MARYTCPSCGASYNGKRCRKCLYQHFTEEITHGGHVHQGEPLVIDAPVRKPVKRKDPFGCEPKTRKGLKLTPALILTVILLVNSTGRLIYSFSQRMDSSNSAVVHAQREPVSFLPEGPLLTLGGNDEITILADWKDGQAFDGSFEVYVQNDSREDVAVTAREVIVNGCLLENTSLYCTAYAGNGSPSFGRALFALDLEELACSGIGAIQEITLTLEAFSLESYETVLETDPITLSPLFPEGAVLHTVPDGVDVYQEDGLRLRYLGFVPQDQHPEDILTGKFLFYVENDTDVPADFYTPEILFNEEVTASALLWTQLPPNTRTVTAVYPYGLENSPSQTLKDLETLSFLLEISAGGNNKTAQITIPLN